MMKALPSDKILSALRCPLCHGEIRLSKEGASAGKSLLCNGERQHCFDFSASGYVNLAPHGHGAAGDSKQAIRARTAFLDGGYYAPVRQALCQALASRLSTSEGPVVDAGCGEGYYSSALAAEGFSVVGLDLSKHGTDKAAKRCSAAHAFFGVASVFDMPLRDASVAGVVNVFAPCAEEEFCRVLQPNGILAVAYAGPEHLRGLKEALYDHVRENDGRADLPRRMKKLEELHVRYDVEVMGTEQVSNLFAMTPYYWRTSVADGEKLKKRSSLRTAVDIWIDIYQKVTNNEEGKANDGCRSH